MNNIPPLNAAHLLKKYGLRPHKGLGQNFLQDPIALEKIAEAAEIKPEDTGLEIGPGLGSLTRYLAASAREVVAVELDQRLLPPLKAVLAPYTNVHLIHGDILELSPDELVQDRIISSRQISLITLLRQSSAISWRPSASRGVFCLPSRRKSPGASAKSRAI